VKALWARRERREKRAERVAGDRNFITSLGIPSGPGALPVPSELIVFIECIAGYHVGEGEGRVPAGFDDDAVCVVRVFPRRDGEYGWGSAAEVGVEVRVDCREDFGGGDYKCFIGSSDFMEGRGCAVVGEEAALNIQETVGGFRACVIGRIGAGFYFAQFVRGGDVEEVAYACLALLLDGVGSEILGRV
jgi:hypothetical protein